jgi:hypothetical protein
VFPVAGGTGVMSEVTPGTYRVVLRVGDRSFSQRATFLPDVYTK